jgi:MFS family permease
MQLENSKSSTAWLGAILGLVLGLVAGGLLATVGTPIEGSEEGLIQLPVLASIATLIIGGAMLGAITAAVPQLFGTPVAVNESDQDEVDQVKERLSGAVGIPVAGLMILLLLVIPFGYLLIQSNHLASGGAALVATVVAAGILGFATLAGSRPEMKISLGDLLVALGGIATVLVIILAVLLSNSDTTHDEEDSGGDSHAMIAQIL